MEQCYKRTRSLGSPRLPASTSCLALGGGAQRWSRRCLPRGQSNWKEQDRAREHSKLARVKFSRQGRE